MKKWLSILCLTVVFALTGCSTFLDSSSSIDGSSTDSSSSIDGSSTDSSDSVDSSSTDSSSSIDDDSLHEHTDENEDGKCDVCDGQIQATLEFFAVNDLHGKFMDTDDNCGVDEMTTYLRNKQAQNPNVVLLSSGDMWQGSSESNLTHGNIITEWMNDLQFASMTLGNHEYDWGEEYIEQNATLAEFPVLGINVFDPDTNERETYAQPSVTIEKSGVKIGIIGAIGDCYSSIASDKKEDVYFKTGDQLTELVKAESTRLREKGADVIVYSLHDSGNSYAEYYDTALSNGYVDLVFEGHSHSSVQKQDEYGVWHLQAGGDNKTGLSYARVNVDLITGDIDVERTQIVEHNEYAALDDDPIVNELLEKYADAIEKMNEYLGMNDEYRNSDALKAYAAQAMFEAGYARWRGDERYADKIVLGGGYLNVRSPYYLRKGKVTYGDIQSLFPFDNYFVLCKVTGTRLLQQFINNGDYVCYYGEDGENIKNNLNGNGTYYVVVDTYCANYDFKGMGFLEIVEYYDKENDFFTRDAFAQFIKNGGLSPASVTETSTIPEILAIGDSLSANEETTEKYRVKGTIVSIDNTTYGNMTIEDEAGNQLFIYGTYDADGNRYDKMSDKPQIGDVVLLEGKIKNYNNSYTTKIELISATVLECLRN